MRGPVIVSICLLFAAVTAFQVDSHSRVLQSNAPSTCKATGPKLDKAGLQKLFGTRHTVESVLQGMPASLSAGPYKTMHYTRKCKDKALKECEEWSKTRGFQYSVFTGFYMWGGIGEATLTQTPDEKFNLVFKSKTSGLHVECKNLQHSRTQCEPKIMVSTRQPTRDRRSLERIRQRYNAIKGPVTRKSIRVTKSCIFVHFQWSEYNKYSKDYKEHKATISLDMANLAKPKVFDRPAWTMRAWRGNWDEQKHPKKYQAGMEFAAHLPKCMSTESKRMTKPQLQKLFKPSLVAEAKKKGNKAVIEYGGYTLVEVKRTCDLEKGTCKKWMRTRGASWGHFTGRYMSGGRGIVRLEMDPSTKTVDVVFKATGYLAHGTLVTCSNYNGRSTDCGQNLKTWNFPPRRTNLNAFNHPGHSFNFLKGVKPLAEGNTITGGKLRLSKGCLVVPYSVSTVDKKRKQRVDRHIVLYGDSRDFAWPPEDKCASKAKPQQLIQLNKRNKRTQFTQQTAQQFIQVTKQPDQQRTVEQVMQKIPKLTLGTALNAASQVNIRC